MTKLELLLVIGEAAPVDSPTIAEAFDTTVQHAAAALHKLHAAGLVRRADAGGRYLYALSRSGVRRLRYLAEQLAEADDEDDDDDDDLDDDEDFDDGADGDLDGGEQPAALPDLVTVWCRRCRMGARFRWEQAQGVLHRCGEEMIVVES